MKDSRFSRILREPLLHFLLMGAALFVLYYEVADPGGEDNTIVVTQENIGRLAAGWERQWSRPPTESELAGLVRAHVREEVLNREAIALGLEQDDPIIRRRLAQKMEFLFADLAGRVTPTEEQLQVYLDENPERFMVPERRSFRHVYFSRDRRGDRADRDAGEALVALTGGDGETDTSTLGDAFMYQYQFQGYSEAEVARLFGRQFAADVFALGEEGWQGPVESGYGTHLVLVESSVPSRMPPLDEIRDKVLNEWNTEKQREADEAFYENLARRYRIEIEEPISGSDGLASE